MFKLGEIKGVDFIFSKFLQGKSSTKKVAYIGLFTAFLLVCNAFLSVPLFDLQFSLTILCSMIAGVVLGPACGFLSCFVADLIGYFINSGGMFYFFWVGLSTSLTAFISACAFIGYNKNKPLLNFIIRIIASILLTFLICTVAINSTGFYIYNSHIGSLTKAIEYAQNTFGKDISFLIYLAYRLIFKGQIYNSIFNYALFVIVMPFLKPLKIFD